MEKEKNIVTKILNNAKQKAETIVSEAEIRASENFAFAKTEIQKNNEKVLADAKESIANLTEQKIKLAGLNAKKQALTAKHELLEKAFTEAKADLLALKDKEYKDLIKKLILKFSQDNDTVIVCKQDEKRLTAAFITSVATAAKKKLTRKVSEGFDGGIILSNKNYDKVLTVDAILKALRSNIESDVAKILFE